MIKAHKIRLSPTPEQQQYFIRAVGTARFAYNWALARWNEEYQAGRKPSALSLKAEFNAIKREQYPWALDVSKTAAEGAFINLGVAFANFFRRVKAGEKRPGYPRFKSRKRSKPAFYIANDKISFTGHSVRIPKLGWVNMAECLRFEGKVMSATVSQVAGHWFVSVAVDVTVPAPVASGDPIGVDLGVKALATVSDGRVFENQKHLGRALTTVRRLNRWVSRKQKGSQNRKKAVAKLARAHNRVSCLRADALHKMTTELAKTATMIGIEDLNVAGMVKNRKLARAINDCAFGEIRRQLEYKCMWYGSDVQVVGRFYPSSRLCNACGEKNTELRLSERRWVCSGCGVAVERDANAALNIRDEALRLRALPVVATSASIPACGRGVRPAMSAVSVEAGTDRCAHNRTPER